jgi:hypothetical protein
MMKADVSLERSSNLIHAQTILLFKIVDERLKPSIGVMMHSTVVRSGRLGILIDLRSNTEYRPGIRLLLLVH